LPLRLSALSFSSSVALDPSGSRSATTCSSWSPESETRPSAASRIENERQPKTWISVTRPWASVGLVVVAVSRPSAAEP